MTQRILLFQHTAARRRLNFLNQFRYWQTVSTHSRPKAAACAVGMSGLAGEVSTHSRPKAADFGLAVDTIGYVVSTHSRPKAAATAFLTVDSTGGFQHTAARRRLAPVASSFISTRMFQHTAARRRLVSPDNNKSQYSWFQHTAARRRLLFAKQAVSLCAQFQHTAARRRLFLLSGYVDVENVVSTHSRPKAAADGGVLVLCTIRVSTHSRPKAAEPLLKALFHQVSQPRFR